MSTQPLLPDPALLTLDGISVRGEVIVFALRTVAPEAHCPLCGHPSQRIHSRYLRTLADLPWQGIPVRFHLVARKFFCDNPACQRRIFAEPLASVAQRYAHKTCRLADALQELAYWLGGE